jgi:hypothetical protein
MASSGSLSHSLSPTDLPAQLSSGRSANDSVFIDFDALVRKLNDKQAEKLKKLIEERDQKELQAAGKYTGIVKEKKLKKKTLQLQKRSLWNLRKRGYVDQKVLDAAEEEIDEELGNAVIPQCYEEIKRLLFIEKNPICAKALQEWSRKETLFTSRVERKKSKVADLKNEIYQLIGFFSVFQGVLLTAVSQSSLLHCNNLWSPILLSVVASVVTIFGAVQKLRHIEGFQETIHSEEQSMKVCHSRSTFSPTCLV